MSEVSQTVSEDDEGAPGEQQYMAAEEDIEPALEQDSDAEKAAMDAVYKNHLQNM